MVVRSVLAIGAEFGLQVVAEGIESEEQHAELQRLGCDYGQGYLYAIPTPAQGIDDLLSLVQAIDVIGREKTCSARPVHVQAGWRGARTACATSGQSESSSTSRRGTPSQMRTISLRSSVLRARCTCDHESAPSFM